MYANLFGFFFVCFFIALDTKQDVVEKTEQAELNSQVTIFI